MQRLKPFIGTIALLALALPLICVGLFVATVFPWALNSSAAEVAQLQPISAVVFEDSSPGRRVLVEGRLSAANPTGAEGFVAYTRSISEPDGESGIRWSDVEQVTPELIVELDGGTIRIGEGYDLRGGDSVSRDDERIRGLRIGDTVLAIGNVVEGTEGGVMLSARWVNDMTRAEYLRTQAAGSVGMRIFGWVVFAAGILLSVFGVLLAVINLRRRRQRLGGASG